MDYYADKQSSSGNYDYFKKTVEKLGTVVEIICTYDAENFIFVDKDVTSKNHHFIARLNTGDKIFLDSINCGYLGSGPRQYQQILLLLNVPYEVSEEIIKLAMSKVTFSNEGNYEKYEVPKYFLDSRGVEGKIHKGFIVNLQFRKLYLLNPEKYLELLFPLLENLNPYRMDYWIGKDSILDNEYRYDKNIKNEFWDSFDIDNKLSMLHCKRKKMNNKRKQHDTAREVNVILRGEKYELLLLIPYELQISFLETLVLYFKGESYLIDNIEDVRSYLFPKSLIEKIIHKKDKENLSGTIDISEMKYD